MRRVALGLVLLLGVGLAAGWFGWYRPTRFSVDIGAGMLAKQMCSCLFVAARAEGACRADQLASLDPIQLEVRSEPRAVRAFVPLFGERIAVHRDGLGCTLE
jgi:hypothetical protein